ncbi:hypothetical protein JX266_007612 [Neoarthrinium moseri]|uniref:uncharacterized protein n=1 Tax=Neoarthrinium moseri TaxID=1658444 RepID=UPI001FDC55A8|nr:uncharacterized protein JN550_008894 [Neoarthrinium moseri]KAI1846407.1 hypothetical protein JX266_007612 [Neoarthrinium moseri]KAI1864337.1 hypothetical protein JN550_008894 [Neoarthrinium moseri]
MQLSLDTCLLVFLVRCHIALGLQLPHVAHPTQRPVVVEGSEVQPSLDLPQKTQPLIQPSPIPTHGADLRNGSMDYNEILEHRALTTDAVTCGYAGGDPTKPRTANSGYNCRIDAVRDLWGSLSGEPYCSTVLLDSGPDLTFSYIACGPTAKTDILLANPTSPTTTTSSSSKTSTTASSSPSISTSTPGSTSSAFSSSLSASLSSFSAAASAEAQASSSDGSSGSNTGAIIGGALGGLALVCITVVAVVFVLRRNLRKRRENGDLGATSNVEPTYGDYAGQQMDSNKTSWAPPYYVPDHQTYPMEMHADATTQRPREPAELEVHVLTSEFDGRRSELDGFTAGRH